MLFQTILTIYIYQYLKKGSIILKNTAVSFRTILKTKSKKKRKLVWFSISRPLFILFILIYSNIIKIPGPTLVMQGQYWSAGSMLVSQGPLMVWYTTFPFIAVNERLGMYTRTIVSLHAFSQKPEIFNLPTSGRSLYHGRWWWCSSGADRKSWNDSGSCLLLYIQGGSALYKVWEPPSSTDFELRRHRKH